MRGGGRRKEFGKRGQRGTWCKKRETLGMGKNGEMSFRRVNSSTNQKGGKECEGVTEIEGGLESRE